MTRKDYELIARAWVCVSESRKGVSTMRTIQDLAKEAIDVQDACNPLGLTKGCARAIQELREALAATGQPDDTAAMCSHPIYRLWTFKLADLAGFAFEDSGISVFADAFEACRQLRDAEIIEAKIAAIEKLLS